MPARSRTPASSAAAPGRAARCSGLRLNFSKRYITLAPVATVIGLAFRMFDPDKLLGEKADIGITVALIPRNTPGITHRPAPLPAEHPVPERAHPGQGRVRAAGLHHRRPEDGRGRLAHAGRAALGGPLHLAALQRHRRRQGRACGRPGPTRASARSSTPRWAGSRASSRCWRAWSASPTPWMPRARSPPVPSTAARSPRCLPRCSSTT